MLGKKDPPQLPPCHQRAWLSDILQREASFRSSAVPARSRGLLPSLATTKIPGPFSLVPPSQLLYQTCFCPTAPVRVIGSMLSLLEFAFFKQQGNFQDQTAMSPLWSPFPCHDSARFLNGFLHHSPSLDYCPYHCPSTTILLVSWGDSAHAPNGPHD